MKFHFSSRCHGAPPYGLRTMTSTKELNKRDIILHGLITKKCQMEIRTGQGPCLFQSPVFGFRPPCQLSLLAQLLNAEAK